MKYVTPKRLLLLSFVFLLLGVVIPFLMVMEVIESTYFLNFFSFIISFLGLVVGIIGATYYVRLNRSD
jgi:hypothetical protein